MKNQKIFFGIFATLLIALSLGLGLAFGLKNITTKKVVDEATKTELVAVKTTLAEAQAAAEASQIKLKKDLQELTNILRSETLKNYKQKKALQDTFKQQLEKTKTEAKEAAAAEQHELITDVDQLTKHLSDAVAEKEAALAAVTRAQEVATKAAEAEAVNIQNIRIATKELQKKDETIKNLKLATQSTFKTAKKVLQELNKKTETLENLEKENNNLNDELLEIKAETKLEIADLKKKLNAVKKKLKKCKTEKS